MASTSRKSCFTLTNKSSLIFRKVRDVFFCKCSTLVGAHFNQIGACVGMVLAWAFFCWLGQFGAGLNLFGVFWIGFGSFGLV